MLRAVDLRGILARNAPPRDVPAAIRVDDDLAREPRVAVRTR